MDPTIIAALISVASLLASTIFKELVHAQPGESNNAGEVENTQNAIVQANPAKTKNAESSSKQAKLKTALEREREREMNGLQQNFKSFQDSFHKIKEEKLVLEGMANEAISTFQNNVQVIMLCHGLGSIFLQLNHPSAGVHILVLLIVSFVSSIKVAFMATSNKTERLTQLDEDLQNRLTALKEEVISFKAVVAQSQNGEALNRMMPSIKRDISTLKKSITKILGSSFSKTNRIMTAINQVTDGAIIYGFNFPVMAYYLLYFVDFGKKGFVNAMFHISSLLLLLIGSPTIRRILDN